MDNSWPKLSPSHPNYNLIDAFQSASQQEAMKRATKNVPSTSLASHTLQPPTSSPPPVQPTTTSTMNPYMLQPNQLPMMSSGYGGMPLPAGTIDPPGYDQLRALSATLALQQPFGLLPQFTMPASSMSTAIPPPPIHFPPSALLAPSQQPAPIPSQPLGLAVKSDEDASKSASAFAQLLSQMPIASTTTQMKSTMSLTKQSFKQETANPILPSVIQPQMPLSTTMNLTDPSSSGLQPPLLHATSGQSTSGLHHPQMSSSMRNPSTSSHVGPGPSAITSPTSAQFPSLTSIPVPPPGQATLVSPGSGQQKKRRSGDPTRPAPSVSPLDFDLDGIDLFEGMNMGDQTAILNSSLAFDEALFSEPIVQTTTAAEPPPPTKPAEMVEEKKEETTSANNKMALLMARLNKSRGGTAAPPFITVTPAAAVAPSATPAVQVIPAKFAVAAAAAPAVVKIEQSDSPDVVQKPIAPADNSTRRTFTSPTGSAPRTSPTPRISSLIAASILPSELMGNVEAREKEKHVPVYLRPKHDAPSAYRRRSSGGPKAFMDSKEAAFDFDDEDPEETGEKLNFSRGEDSYSEPENVAPVGSANTQTMERDPEMDNRILSILEDAKRMGYDPKDTDKEKAEKKEAKKVAPVIPGRARQETLEFAERLRKRQGEKQGATFATVQLCDQKNQCAIDSVQRNAEEADKPPLPRLIIRLPKKSTDGNEENPRHRKKRRQYYDDDEEDSEEEDDDWYGARPKKRRGRKPKRELNPEETYSARLVDPSTIEHARREVQLESMAKMERGIRNVEGRAQPKSLAKIVAEYKNAEARQRLDTFKQCTGFTPRGTFLVLKSELNTPDCSLWRVDSMNLLQKFAGYLARTEEGGEKRMLYKNSSTYSGWCEQLQPDYMVVEVRLVKQTRSECVVEPLIPLDDLFPALSEELGERYCVPVLKALINKEDTTAQSAARTFILKDDVRNGLYMVMRSIIGDALSVSQEKTQTAVIATSDPLLDEMQSQIKECEEAIRDRIVFPSHFEQQLRRYSSCMSFECDMEELDCQVCGEAPVDKKLQLFDPIVDSEREDKENCDPETTLPAVEVLTCTVCGRYAQWLHRLIHFRNDLTRKIEDRLLEATIEMPALAPDQIVDNLRQYYTWLKEIIIAHTDTWDAIMEPDDSDDEFEESTELPASTLDTPSRNGERVDPAPL